MMCNGSDVEGMVMPMASVKLSWGSGGRVKVSKGML